MQKLGSQTGSLINHVYSGFEAVCPVVGMGATVLAWTDRYAGTVVEVNDDGSFVVQEDTAIRTDSNGMSEAQSYRYERNENGRTFKFAPVKRGNAKGQIRENGKKDGRCVLLGDRRAYHDFSF